MSTIKMDLKGIGWGGGGVGVGVWNGIIWLRLREITSRCEESNELFLP
jgi:hypothetical protein